jgi:AraC-like DNA-binding protein
LVPGSHDELSVGPELTAPQGFVTRFQLATNRAPETLNVYRLSSLRDVEFWSTTGCQGQRTQLSDMFSAALVLGSGQSECGKAWTRSEQVGFRPGDILLADAGEVQGATTPVDRVTEFFTIYWKREALDEFGGELGCTAPSHWTRTVLASGPLSAELAQLLGLLQSGASARSIEQAYRSVTAALLHRAGPSTESGATRPGLHPSVRRAAERVRASFADPLSLSDLASEMNLSKFYLARTFQRSLGVPPHRYRRLLRLQCARRLLERGFTVVDAALETGFVDAPHLSRAFCEWLGVSPAAWRSAWCAADPWSKPPRSSR